MKNGQCPKCQSVDVYKGSSSPLHASEGLVHLEAYPPNRGVNLLLDAYVCHHCGYTEMYVADGSMAKLDAIAQDNKNWKKVG